MKLRKGILCYGVAMSMTKSGICPFEECQGYYESIETCEKCVGKFFEGKDKTKFELLP